MGIGSTAKEDVRPLAPSTAAGHDDINHHIIVGSEGISDHGRGGGSSSQVGDEEARYNTWKSSLSGKGGATSGWRRRRYFRLCCSCFVSTLVLLAILILVLALTVFKVKDPEIRMNSVYLDRFSVDRLSSLSSSSSSSGGPALDLTVTVGISVKNPNAASFKFGNATTYLSYHGDTVGEAKSPAGRARSRRTLRMNVTVEVDADRLIRNSDQLARDLISGTLPVNTYTKLGGRVNFLNVFKRHVDVVFNCSIAVAISTSSIQDQRCERRVKL